MPADPVVSWNANHPKIIVHNHTLMVSEYVEQVQEALIALSQKVEDNILFGFS